MNLGKSIRIALAVEGLKIGDLANKSGISRQHISCIINNKKSPRMNSLQLISDALGYSVSDLIKLGEDNSLNIAS